MTKKQSEILKLKGLINHEGWVILKQKLEEKLMEEIGEIERNPLLTLRDIDVWRGGRSMLRRVMSTPNEILLEENQGEIIPIDPEEISVL